MHRFCSTIGKNGFELNILPGIAQQISDKTLTEQVVAYWVALCQFIYASESSPAGTDLLISLAQESWVSVMTLIA